MAKTLNADGVVDKMFVSFPIMKFESNEDGDLVVYGKATDGSVDSDHQIVDPKWSGPALKQWLDTGGNVRVQHNPNLYPAGKGLSVEESPDGHFVKALVVEPTAKKLVKAGVLQAYSVGIARPVIERDISGKAMGGIIKGGELFELSLVDRPANKNCSITLSKSEGELVKSEDGTDHTTWTYGDLEGALEAVEISKAERGKQLAKAYRDERSVWIAEEPDPSSATQGPEYLAKRAEWQQWMSDGESRGLTEGGHSLWLTKRQMDSSVGGGVDRDKIPAADFAGRDRSFPIVTPGDVSDAASSIGRAGDDNFSSDQLRENITRIANRKGPSFVAELPASWREGKEPATKAKKKAKKPAFVIGAQEGSKTDEIPVRKGYDSDKCPVCGYAVKDGSCACCDAYPCTCDPGEMKDKATKKKKGGKKKPFMSGEGSDASFGEDGTSLKEYAQGGVVTKCVCGNCGSDMDDGDLFCSQCGTAAAGGDMGEGGGGQGPMEKSLMPTRAAKDTKKKGKKGFLPPAGDHREPDGDTSVEQLEGDMGKKPKRDPKKDKVPSSVDAKAQKSEKVVPYGLRKMHDAVCAVYHADDVLAEYPSLKSIADALRPDYFQRRAEEAVAKGDHSAAAELQWLVGEVESLKSADPELVADARAEVHKSFTDLYPTVRIKPSAPPKPGSFQRPYLSAGHAPSTSTGKKPKMPAGGRNLDPGKFDRGPLTSGQERQSPANKAGNNPTGNVGTGSSRELYASASRTYEANRIKAIHDHIERTTTGLCSMAPSPAVMPPRNGADNMPMARNPLDTSAGAAASTKSEGVDPAALQDFIDSKVSTATKSIKKKYKTQILALRAELDKLGRQPDPTQAPVRGGTVRTKAAGGLAPVERRSLAIEAQEKAALAEKAAYINYLQTLTESGNPDTRERALKAMADAGVSDPYSS